MKEFILKAQVTPPESLIIFVCGGAYARGFFFKHQVILMCTHIRSTGIMYVSTQLIFNSKSPLISYTMPHRSGYSGAVHTYGWWAHVQIAGPPLQSFWFSEAEPVTRTSEFAYLANSQVIQMLLVGGPHFGKHGLSYLPQKTIWANSTELLLFMWLAGF